MTTTPRPETHQSQGPGKYEAEACWTRWAHGVVMDGGADQDEEGAAVIVGPVTLQEVRDWEIEADDQICAECLAELLQADSVTYWEDEQGFAYSELDREYVAAFRSNKPRIDSLGSS